MKNVLLQVHKSHKSTKFCIKWHKIGINNAQMDKKIKNWIYCKKQNVTWNSVHNSYCLWYWYKCL